MTAKKKPEEKRPPQRRGPVLTEVEASFCHYLIGTDADGKRRTPAKAAELAGLDAGGADALAASARVREYCEDYARELARQMARHEAMRRANYELSPMAIAGELLFILKHGKDERAQVAAGAKLLDWFGPMEERFKRATDEDLRYLAAHGHWPEDRRLEAPKASPPTAPPSAAANAVIDQVLVTNAERVMEYDF